LIVFTSEDDDRRRLVQTSGQHAARPEHRFSMRASGLLEVDGYEGAPGFYR
jgi:hypothetical protein